jgi:dTMP kinase
MPLVVLEGIDGAGTTTQTARLGEALVARGHRVHLTREPSTGPVGKLLRAMLGGSEPASDATTMALLFAADRADHMFREVGPALARGEIVVSDRWYHSSLAYQGDGEERAWIRTLNGRARRPDLTLFLEVDPEVAARRRAADRRPEELYDAIETQVRIARGYREVVAELSRSERIVTLDGEQPLAQVSAEILRHVLAVLP